MNPIHVAAGALAGIVVGYIAGRFLPAGSKKNNRKSNGRKDNAQRGQDNSKPSRGGKFATTRTGKGVELYVGNLAYGIREKDMAQAFGKSGKVLSARVIRTHIANFTYIPTIYRSIKTRIRKHIFHI